MKTNDHLQLGRVLLDSITHEMSEKQQRAFLFGCVEPDLNPLTRLRGLGRKNLFMGHNAENSEKHIRKCIGKIGPKKNQNMYRCFVLGSMIHYLADAFTYVHNGIFKGSLEEHMDHEWDLHYEIMKLREYDRESEEHVLHTFLASHISKLHDDYRHQPMNAVTDLKYIVKSCDMAIRSIIAKPCAA